MKPHICLVSGILAFTIFAQASLQIAMASSLEPSKESAARLTEAHGDVYKRGFKDWSKQLWDSPTAASVGDVLNEGMQVGTGPKSWAELKWIYITARIWANSVYAVAPNNRIVYLTGGQMLYHLDKHRKDKDPYYVWTNLLQARVRGTTLLFTTTERSSSVTCIEGSVDVTNKLDRSTVHIGQGVTYEVALKSAPKTPVPNASTPEGADSKPPTGAPLDVQDSQLPPLSIDHLGTKPLQVFETEKTISTLKIVDPAKVLSLPILTSFAAPFESLPLISQSMGSLSQDLTKVSNALSSLTQKQQLFAVLKAPTAVSYRLGAGITLPPEAVQYFPPIGFIGGTSADGAILDSPLGTSPPSDLAANITSRLMGGSSVSGGSITSSITQTSVLPQQIPQTNISALSPGNLTALQSSATTGLTTSLSSVANGSLLTNTTNTIGQTTGAVTGSLVNTVTTLLNGVGGVLGGGQGRLLP